MGIRVLPDYCGGSNKELPLSPNSQCKDGLHGNSRTIRAGLAPPLDHPTVHTTSIPGRLRSVDFDGKEHRTSPRQISISFGPLQDCTQVSRRSAWRCCGRQDLPRSSLYVGPVLRRVPCDGRGKTDEKELGSASPSRSRKRPAAHMGCRRPTRLPWGPRSSSQRNTGGCPRL